MLQRKYSTNIANFTPFFACFALLMHDRKAPLFNGEKCFIDGQMNANEEAGPITKETPVQFGGKLPDAVDLVVIGGGVIGIFTALYARRRGFSVLVCEKGRVAGEQSSRNWGWIRQHGRDEAELPIMMEASRLWEDADRAVSGQTGFHRGGVTYLASSEASFARKIKWLDIAKRHGLETEILDGPQATGLFGGAAQSGSPKWVGATCTPSDARAEPWRAVPAIAQLAAAEGVHIVENCSVRALDVAAGTVGGVHTELGRVTCEQVLLAGGAWSSLFARRHGVNLPQLSVRSSVVRTAPLPSFFEGNAADETLSLRRRADGGYTMSANRTHDLFVGPDAFRHFLQYFPVIREHIHETRLLPFAPGAYPDAWTTRRRWAEDVISPFEHMRVLDPKPGAGTAARAQEAFVERFPSVGRPKILNVWAGMIDTMPDVVPVVDQAPDLKGLWIATGMSGHGFGIGPGFGRVLADLMTGREAGHDLSRFRLSRFSDGSKLVPGPSI